MRLRIGNWAGATALALAACALAIPARAESAVTIGEDTTPTPPPEIGWACSRHSGNTCTFVQSAHPTRSFTSPLDGVIVRWRIRGDSRDTQFRLRVLKDNGGDSFTGRGTSEPQTVIPGVENVFATRLAVKQGEYIGMDLPGGDPLPILARTPAVPGTQLSVWLPPLADGETREGDTYINHALLYNADVEPDCDADGFGDETQDPDTSSCPTADTDATDPPDTDPPETEITKGAPNETGRTKVEFKFRGDEPGSTFECKRDKERWKGCSSPKTVKRLDDGKHKFKVRAIDAAGNVDPSPAKDKFRVER
jgi:hypothetical protein